MSEQHTNPFAEVPGYQDLRTYQEKLVGLEQVLEGDTLRDSPTMRAGFEKAAAVAQGKIAEIAQSEAMQHAIANLGTAALEAIAAAPQLSGLLESEEIEALVASEEQKLSGVREFFERYGASTEASTELKKRLAGGGMAVAATTEPVAEIAEPAPQLAKQTAESHAQDAPESEPGQTAPKKQLQITMRNDELRIGKQGKLVKFDSRNNDSQYDYTKLRRLALTMILESDTPVKPVTIRDAMMELGEDITNAHFNSVRTWLLELSHRNQKIIQHTSKRGNGSFYSANPEFEITLVTSHRSSASKRAEANNPQEQPEIVEAPEAEAIDDEPAQSEAIAVQAEEDFAAAQQESAMKESAEATPEVIKTNEFIALGDLYSVALRIERLREVLPDFNMEPMNAELLVGLRQYAPNQCGLSDQEILDSREAAMHRIVTVIGHEEQFLELINSLESQTPEADFIDYISDQLERVESTELLVSLLTAKLVRCDRRDARGVYEASDFILVDANGRQIWPEAEIPSAFTPAQPEPRVTITRLAGGFQQIDLDIPTQPHKEPDPEVEPAVTSRPTESVEQPSHQDVAEPRTPGKRRKTRGGASKEQKKKSNQAIFIERADALADAFCEAFNNPNGTYPIRSIEAIFGNFPKAVMAANDSNAKIYASGASTTGRPEYGLAEFLEIQLKFEPATQNFAKIRSNQRRVDNIITRIVRRHEERAKSAQSQTNKTQEV